MAFSIKESRGLENVGNDGDWPRLGMGATSGVQEGCLRLGRYANHVLRAQGQAQCFPLFTFTHVFLDFRRFLSKVADSFFTFQDMRGGFVAVLLALCVFFSPQYAPGGKCDTRRLVLLALPLPPHTFLTFALMESGEKPSCPPRANHSPLPPPTPAPCHVTLNFR